MIINKFFQFYNNTKIGYYLIHPLFHIYDLLRKNIPDDVIVKSQFKKNMGYRLNLKIPKTLNEKINWLKLYDRTPLHTICADKFKVREYIAANMGNEYLIPLILNTTNPKDIVPEKLPDFPIIIKTNHKSGEVFIIRDKKHINWKRVQFCLKKSLRKNYFYATREWQYKNIKPRIIVEKLLLDENGNIPYDYKMHFFNGKLVFTQVDLDRLTNHTRNLYDKDWNLIPCKWFYKNGKQIKKPATYEKMQLLAHKVVKDFIYLRVDFYEIEKRLFFGELTFHPESGIKKFEPKFYDEYWGSLLNLNIE